MMLPQDDAAQQDFDLIIPKCSHPLLYPRPVLLSCVPNMACNLGHHDLASLYGASHVLELQSQGGLNSFGTKF